MKNNKSAYVTLYTWQYYGTLYTIRDASSTLTYRHPGPLCHYRSMNTGFEAVKSVQLHVATLQVRIEEIVTV